MHTKEKVHARQRERENEREGRERTETCKGGEKADAAARETKQKPEKRQTESLEPSKKRGRTETCIRNCFWGETRARTGCELSTTEEGSGSGK